jgi:hypothetical protein
MQFPGQYLSSEFRYWAKAAVTISVIHSWEESMNEKIMKVLIPVLTIGLFICAVLLFQQRAQLAALQGQLAEQGEQLARIGKALKISQARQASNIKIRSLPSGVYELATEVTVDPFGVERDEYTIYNFVLDIRVGAVRRKLQFGYAYSGFLAHVIYFDHDSGSIPHVA